MSKVNFLCGWPGQSLILLKQDKHYQKYFKDVSPTRIENTIYISNLANGIELVLNDNKVITSIHLFSGNNEQYGHYTEDIPYDLKFSMNRNDIVEKLGIPQKSGGNEHHNLFGYIPLWDTYHMQNCTLHIEYAPVTNIVNIITISSQDARVLCS